MTGIAISAIFNITRARHARISAQRGIGHASVAVLYCDYYDSCHGAFSFAIPFRFTRLELSIIISRSREIYVHLNGLSRLRQFCPRFVYRLVRRSLDFTDDFAPYRENDRSLERRALRWEEREI
jgi:hypothetical protein